jgi:hypothetical protein
MSIQSYGQLRLSNFIKPRGKAKELSEFAFHFNRLLFGPLPAAHPL